MDDEIEPAELEELEEARMAWQIETGRCYECGMLVLECICDELEVES